MLRTRRPGLLRTPIANAAAPPAPSGRTGESAQFATERGADA